MELLGQIDIKNVTFDIQMFSPENREKIYALLEEEMMNFLVIDSYLLTFQNHFLEASEERFSFHLQMLGNVFHLMEHLRRPLVLFLFKRQEKNKKIALPEVLKSRLEEMDFREFKNFDEILSFY